MNAFREAIYDIVATNHPCSAQIYYVGIGHALEKDRGGNRRSYNDVVRNPMMRERRHPLGLDHRRHALGADRHHVPDSPQDASTVEPDVPAGPVVAATAGSRCGLRNNFDLEPHQLRH